MDVFANKQKITLNQSSFKAAGGEEKGITTSKQEVDLCEEINFQKLCNLRQPNSAKNENRWKISQFSKSNFVSGLHTLYGALSEQWCSMSQFDLPKMWRGVSSDTRNRWQKEGIVRPIMLPTMCTIWIEHQTSRCPHQRTDRTSLSNMWKIVSLRWQSQEQSLQGWASQEKLLILSDINKAHQNKGSSRSISWRTMLDVWLQHIQWLFGFSSFGPIRERIQYQSRVQFGLGNNSKRTRQMRFSMSKLPWGSSRWFEGSAK